MVHLSLNILLFVFIFQSSMLVLAGIGMAAIGFGGKECDKCVICTVLKFL